MRRILIGFLTIVLCLVMVGCGTETGNTSADTSVELKAETPDSYIGRNIEAVVSELRSAGFVNIQSEEVKDLTSDRKAESRIVTDIKINGKDSFTQEDSFTKEAVVKLTFHSMKKVKVPFSSADAESIPSEEIMQRLKDAGFEDVTYEEVYDYDPDTCEDPFINSVKIGYSNSFVEGQAFPCDSSVSVLCHYPYEKYTLFLHVDFVKNILFNKYDVTIRLDGEVIDTMIHGKNYDSELRLTPGTYAITFTDALNSEVSTSVSVDVYSDTSVGYTVSCKKNEIRVKEK